MKVQLYAARIVTGLSIITSRTSLYLETGWEPLVNRRDHSKLSTMYKIYNKLVPSYLKEITLFHITTLEIPQIILCLDAD